jgi:hypothetical protein
LARRSPRARGRGDGTGRKRGAKINRPPVCPSPADSHGNGLSCVPHANTGAHSNMRNVSVQATVSFIIAFRKRRFTDIILTVISTPIARHQPHLHPPSPQAGSARPDATSGDPENRKSDNRGLTPRIRDRIRVAERESGDVTLPTPFRILPEPSSRDKPPNGAVPPSCCAHA